MSAAQTMVKLMSLPDILRAAQVLETHGLLTNNESANDVVKRFVNSNPDINSALAASKT